MVDVHKSLKYSNRAGAVCSVALIITAGSLLHCHGRLNEAEQRIIDTPIICQVFEPITWTKSDSLKTREQINAYNTLWDSYCKVIKEE